MDENNWVAVQAGILNMPTTRIFIVYIVAEGQFGVFRDDVRHGTSQTLDGAKMMAKDFVADLLSIGIEP